VGGIRYLEGVENLIREIKTTQAENIKKASEIIAHSIMNGAFL